MSNSSNACSSWSFVLSNTGRILHMFVSILLPQVSMNQPCTVSPLLLSEFMHIRLLFVSSNMSQL